MKRKSIILISSIILTLAGFIAAYAVSVGQELQNVNIRDAYDKPATIPDFGSKVLTLIYCDTDASDISDPISDALKARNYPKSTNLGIGIADLKNSPVPNWVIRQIIKRKIAKYDATILTDVDLTVAKAWGLGDCNNKSNVIILGKDKKVKYAKTFDKNNKPTQNDIDTVVKLVDSISK